MVTSRQLWARQTSCPDPPWRSTSRNSLRACSGWVPRVAFPAESMLADEATATLLVVHGPICVARTVVLGDVQNERVYIRSGVVGGIGA